MGYVLIGLINVDDCTLVMLTTASLTTDCSTDCCDANQSITISSYWNTEDMETGTLMIGRLKH